MSTTTYIHLDFPLLARQRPPILAGFLARVRSLALDRALAAGADPASSRVLAVRAERICRFDRRRRIASCLLEVARGFTGHGIRIALAPSTGAVTMAWGDLETLASELARPGPADPEGVARARLLLTDGASPLYPPGRGQQLAARARQACERLRGAEALCKEPVLLTKGEARRSSVLTRQPQRFAPDKRADAHRNLGDQVAPGADSPELDAKRKLSLFVQSEHSACVEASWVENRARAELKFRCSS